MDDRKEKYNSDSKNNYGKEVRNPNHEFDEALEGDGRRGGGRKFSGGTKKRSCRFTAGEEEVSNVTYKNPRFISTFLTENGKIVPRRVTGNCAAVQRKLTTEIKRARTLALLGYTSVGPNS